MKRKRIGQSALYIFFTGVIKMRDIGKTTVIVHALPGKPEEVTKNRINVKMALESALTRRNGYDTKAAINWGEEK